MKMPKVFYEGMEILLSVIIINIEHQSVCFTINGKVSAKNTKYAGTFHKNNQNWNNNLNQFLFRILLFSKSPNYFQ